MDQLVTQEFKGRKDHKVQEVQFQDHKGQLDQLVQSETQDRKDRKDHVDMGVAWAVQDSQDQLVIPAAGDTMAVLATQAVPAMQAVVGPWDILAQLVTQAV